MIQLPTKQHLSLLRSYAIEVMVIGLTCCTVFLFKQVNELNAFIRTESMEKTVVIQENTNAIKNLLNNFDNKNNIPYGAISNHR